MGETNNNICIMDNKERSRIQQEILKEKQEAFEREKEKQLEYFQSEQYQRDRWEQQQDFWEAKARREGWSYERKPFNSAADKEKQARQAKEEEAAFLRAKLSQLESELQQ